jgi:hypothetical protein
VLLMRNRNSRARRGTPRHTALARLVSIACLGLASPAGAESAIFDLATGNLNTGSGVAFGGGGVIGLYPNGSTIPVEVTFGDPTTATLDFDLSTVGIPNATENLSGMRFEFTILPDPGFSLTLDATTGEINEDLLDPQVLVLIDMFEEGGSVPIASTTAMMDLTTGILPVTGGCSGPARVGFPLDPDTDEVSLVGVACVAQLGSITNTILDMKLTGTLPVPEAPAAPLGAAALASLVALSRARRATDRES